MYERLLNKEVIPTIEEITNYIGSQSKELLNTFEVELNDRYDIIRELRFPYGKSYGWSFKFSHRKQYLCDLFFEKFFITITIPISSKVVEKLNEQLKDFLPKTRKMWEEQYSRGDGGWINYRVLNEKELNYKINSNKEKTSKIDICCV